jgi:hypothetical protein
MQRTFLACLILAVLMTCSTALAQTGPDLLLRPFPRERTAEASGSAVFLGEGETDNADADFRLSLYESSGRARIFPKERADPRVGYDLLYLDVDTDDPALPDWLIDHSFAFGMGVLDVHGWLGGLTVGVGYAGDEVYDDANAWYYMATFAIGREIDETSQIGIAIDYNGNRSIYPDVPLPGFQYRKRIDSKLVLGVGFPVTTVEWKPIEKLTFDLDFSIPDWLDARVDYQVIKQIGVFAELTRRIDAFAVEGLPGERRLIFEQKRAEVGVRWEPVENASLIVAGGYAFDQEFNVGFDTRHAPNVAEPSDEPYVRVGFEVRY